MRPLYLEEVAEIFILDHENAVAFDKEERLFIPEEVLTYLPGLVTKVSVVIDDKESFRKKESATEIRFAHYSIKEYLSSTRITQQFFSTREQTAGLHISESCLAYHVQLSESILATEESLRQYALWEYVARFLVAHLEEIGVESWTASVRSRATRAFTAQSQSLLNMVRIRDPDHNEEHWHRTSDKLAKPLYYTASMNAIKLTSLLIDGGADVNDLSSAGYYGTALQAAVCWGHKAIIKLLLENGAEVNTQGGFYGNALQAAAALKGCKELVPLFLKKGADVNSQGGHYGNALQGAAHAGEQEIVRLLLDNGADVNAPGGLFGNALQAAADCEYREIVELLLSNGANVNAKGGDFGTALQAAAYDGDSDMVQLLLNNGADVNAQEGEYGSALQTAVQAGEQGIVRLLLHKGADVNSQGGGFGTALQGAAYEGRWEITQMLLHSGADIYAKGGRFGNSLQAAIAEDKLDIAEILLALGASVDSPGPEWEQLLARLDKDLDDFRIERLRKYQASPDGYIALRRRELEKEDESS